MGGIVKECARLQQEQSGGDALYHNTIQIGQTLKRFIYLFTDQVIIKLKIHFKIFFIVKMP